MGRINEALRRSGAIAGQSPRLRGTQDHVFVSPWSVGGDGSSAGAVEAPPPVDPFINRTDDRPAAAHRTEANRTEERPAAKPPAIRFKDEWKAHLAIGPGADPIMAEQFRRCAATMIQSFPDAGQRRVMVTSAHPGDGKTLTAINLALVLSESYKRRVLLIDADLRRPTISEATSLTGVEGLSEAIRSREDTKASLIQATETLTFLPAGRPVADPLSSISSQRMGRLLEEAGTRFDWVIIDTPPVEATVDASLICPLVDAAILVVRAGKTPHAAIQHAIDTLGRDRILGVILNGVEDSHEHTSYGYGYGRVASPESEGGFR